MSPSPAGTPEPLRVERKARVTRVVAQGHWTVAELGALEARLHQIGLQHPGQVEIDATGIASLDSAGAWLLLRTRNRFEGAGASVVGPSVPPVYQTLLTMVGGHDAQSIEASAVPAWNAFLERVGRGAVQFGEQAHALLGFLGHVTIETASIVVRPKGFRVKAWVHQIDETGVTALPILGLLAFLLGVVIAYQGADQLRRFGAQVFTINLLGISILREIGGLIAAIIVAGRSGSSFTAQIGTMKVNQEIDAMQALGLNIVEILVLPRALGLLITLPILTLYADVMGLVGGAVISYFYLDLSIPLFLRQLQGAINLNTLMVGLIKAPFFATVIALVGCFEGLRVEGNAASVGKLTTRSVVESIFLIIVFDAGFSILFSILRI